jgi:hypothetical protein
MRIIEKFKLFLAAVKLLGEMKKMKKLMALLDGKKTIIGLIIVVGAHIASACGLPVPEQVFNTGIALAGVGVVHKFEKLFAVITLVLKYGHRALDVLQKIVDALKKEEKPAA